MEPYNITRVRITKLKNLAYHHASQFDHRYTNTLTLGSTDLVSGNFRILKFTSRDNTISLTQENKYITTNTTTNDDTCTMYRRARKNFCSVKWMK